MTPLLASEHLALKKDFALFVLSLRPEVDLHLNDLENNTLRFVAHAGMVRLMEVLLRRPEAPLFGAGGGETHIFTCIAASRCNLRMLWVYLEAHRERGTLIKALEFPCGCGGEEGEPNRHPLLHHVIISTHDSATVAITRLLVKESGADAVAHYPCSPYDEVTPLLASASLGNAGMMEFLISGRSTCLRPLFTLLSPSLSGARVGLANHGSSFPFRIDHAFDFISCGHFFPPPFFLVSLLHLWLDCT